MVLTGGPAVALDEATDEVVEGRPEVVDDLTEYHAQSNVDGLEDAKVRDIAARLRVSLEVDSIGVALVPEGPPLGIEKYRLLVRPVELGPDAREV